MNQETTPPLAVAVLPSDTIVTQYGNSGDLIDDLPFKHRPPFDDGQIGLSVIVGEWSVEDAWRKIDGRRRQLLPTAGVRYAEVATFEEAGFKAVSSPRGVNPDHGSVKRDGVWDDISVDEAFDRCFSEPVWWQD